MAAVDVVVAAIVVAALLRGLMIGLVREGFSIAALAGAVVAVRLGTDPLAAWLRQEMALGWSDLALRIAAGAILAAAAIFTVAVAGRALRRAIRAAGLGWADRLGGGVLGTAEGLLVAGVLLAVAATALGHDHATLAGSRSLAALDEARRLARDAGPGIDVAAPPPSRGASPR